MHLLVNIPVYKEKAEILRVDLEVRQMDFGVTQPASMGSRRDNAHGRRPFKSSPPDELIPTRFEFIIDAYDFLCGLPT